MGHITYNAAVSLDGFIAPPDESTGWIVEDASIDFDGIFASFDVFIMGRKTYQAVTESTEANPLRGRPRQSVVVISKTLKPADYPDITIVSENHLDYIRAMRDQEQRRIWLMGGGLLAAECLSAGILDSLELAVMPVLLGGGYGLFGTPADKSLAMQRLDLRSVEHLHASGILMTKYIVKPS
jgi:dihydrofolate reductase